MKKQLVLLLLFPFFMNYAHAQLNMAGIGITHGATNVKDIDLDSRLTGGHFSIETPLGGYSFRFDLAYLSRLGDKPAIPSLDNLLNVRLGYGVIIGEGKRFQIPLFGHAGYNSSSGDLQLKHWGVGARGGIRIFLTPKIAIYGDVNGDYIFANNTKYINASGIEQVLDLNPINIQFNAGLMFMYLKKNKE